MKITEKTLPTIIHENLKEKKLREKTRKNKKRTLERIPLREKFPPQVIQEAEDISLAVDGEAIQKRVDLRDTFLITIDGEDARDHDDAISIEKTRDGHYLLGVHIADVSHYVTEGSALDEEAYQRATSVYFPAHVLPMLPPQLSNDICSLHEGQDRLAISLFMDFDPEGHLCQFQLRESVIRIHKALTYEVVYDILLGHGHAPLAMKESLHVMADLSSILKERRQKRGCLDFVLPEAKVRLGENGTVDDILVHWPHLGHQIIEEFMLIANQTVAQCMQEVGKPFIFRIHPKPPLEKLLAFQNILRSFGFPSDVVKGASDFTQLQMVIKAFKGEKEERLINYLLLRSLQEARYSVENHGHFGLAADHYTHFTSPIRRYPDLLVHRLLKLFYLRKKKKHTLSKETLASMAEHCSKMERVAMEAERDSIKAYQMRFMKDKVGEEFQAMITGVAPIGLFVEIDDYMVDGLIPLTTLPFDHYLYKEDLHLLQGLRTKRTYRMGERVMVQVTKVNEKRRQMDCLLKATLKSN